MFDFTASDALFTKIYKDTACLDAIKHFIHLHSLSLRFFLRFCRQGRWEVCLRQKPMFKLALVYLYLPAVYGKYRQKGIEDKVFYDTMDDIRIWIDDYKRTHNAYGLQELNWIMLHMTLSIFKLGRLQFQLCKYYFNPVYKKDGVTIKFGDKILNVHIPRGGRLDIDDCLASFAAAESFFKLYFPQYPTDRFICHSWLLYSGNRSFMKADGNILQFAKLFDIVNEVETPAQAYLWLFQKKVNPVKLLKARRKTGTYGSTSALPQISSLQKSAVAYIEKGGTFGDAMGVLLRKG